MKIHTCTFLDSLALFYNSVQSFLHQNVFSLSLITKNKHVQGWFVCILGADGKCVGPGRGCDGEG